MQAGSHCGYLWSLSITSFSTLWPTVTCLIIERSIRSISPTSWSFGIHQCFFADSLLELNKLNKPARPALLSPLHNRQTCMKQKRCTCLLYTFSEPTRHIRISDAVFCLKKKIFLMIRRPPRSTRNCSSARQMCIRDSLNVD